MIKSTSLNLILVYFGILILPSIYGCGDQDPLKSIGVPAQNDVLCDLTGYTSNFSAEYDILPGAQIAGMQYDFGVAITNSNMCSPLPKGCDYVGRSYWIEFSNSDPCNISLNDFEDIFLYSPGGVNNPFSLDLSNNRVNIPQLFPGNIIYFKWNPGPPCEGKILTGSMATGGVCIIGNLNNPDFPDPIIEYPLRK